MDQKHSATSNILGYSYNIDNCQMAVADSNGGILRIIDDDPTAPPSPSIAYRIDSLPATIEDNPNSHAMITDGSDTINTSSPSSPTLTSFSAVPISPLPSVPPQHYYVINNHNANRSSQVNVIVAPGEHRQRPHSQHTTANTIRSSVIQPSRRKPMTPPKQPVAIAAKPSPTMASPPSADEQSPSKPAVKRDERRRLTHNEVERRRRDTINHWIEKLGSVIPVDGEPSSSLMVDRETLFSSTSGMVDGQSKGEILSKACEYVTALHRKVSTLDACLKESEKVCADARRLRESNARLAIENELLRERLAKMGISPPRPCIVLAPPAAVPKSDA